MSNGCPLALEKQYCNHITGLNNKIDEIKNILTYKTQIILPFLKVEVKERVMPSFQDFVKNQLNKLPHKAGLKVHDSCAWVKCPFHKSLKSPDGLERTPSLRINLIKSKFPIGSFKCFACGKFSSNWNDFAEAWGLKPSSKTRAIVEEEYTQPLITDELKQELFGSTEDFSVETRVNFDGMLEWDKNKSWRGIDGRILKKIEAKMALDEVINDVVLYLPVKVNTVHIGGIKAILEVPPNFKGLKYINISGSWGTKALFPYDFTKKLIERRNIHTVLLVEGPRDALNCLQYGIPAMAILGSHSWSKAKIDLLLDLDIHQIILAFDPDEAGKIITVKVFKDLKNYFDVKKFSMKPGEDPGNLSKKRLKFLSMFIE